MTGEWCATKTQFYLINKKQEWIKYVIIHIDQVHKQTEGAFYQFELLYDHKLKQPTQLNEMADVLFI